MVRHAKSEELKTIENSRLKKEWQAHAVAAYQDELVKRAQGGKAKSARAICDDFMRQCKLETGKNIHLNHCTLINHTNGKPTRAEANEAKSWLSREETEVVIAYIIELGNQGFPLSHRRLKEHVDEICHAKLGNQFPEAGVGKKWTHRFVQKHSDRISMAWSAGLEQKRGQAVNQTTKEAWDRIYQPALEKYGIEGGNLYQVDETGVTGLSGKRERVMGKRAKGPQYQQQGGNRENTTVLVTICADGTALPPAVVFKGKGYKVEWKDNNPANASVGYSKTGWTNGEIGVEWIKIFDQQTKAKAAGKYRMLLVDGHNSHYTRGFLEYARLNKIVVLCYPAHTTHVYQGLDVVVFATLKKCIGEERVAWERKTGGKMSKENFLEIYGRAHLRALTPETIKAAFRVPGMWPVNPDAITAEMMAPSRTTAMEGTLPVLPATPIRIVGKLLKDLAGLVVANDLMPINEDDVESDSEWEEQYTVLEANPFHDIEERQVDSENGVEDEGEMADDDGEGNEWEDWNGIGSDVARENSHPTSIEECIREAVRKLKGSTLTCLINNFPTIPNLHVKQALPPTTMTIPTALSIQPQTENEAILLAALRMSNDENEYSRRRILELQAANVLNEAHCKALSEKLAYRDEKTKKGKKKANRLMGNGLPVMLTSDWFFQRAVEFEEETERKEHEKEQRRVDRAARREGLDQWRREEEERLEANRQKRAQYKLAVEAWEKKKSAWMTKKKAGDVTGAFQVPKPKLGKLPGKKPKPGVVVEDDGSDNDAESGLSGSGTSDKDSE